MNTGPSIRMWGSAPPITAASQTEVGFVARTSADCVAWYTSGGHVHPSLGRLCGVFHCLLLETPTEAVLALRARRRSAGFFSGVRSRRAISCHNTPLGTKTMWIVIPSLAVRGYGYTAARTTRHLKGKIGRRSVVGSVARGDPKIGKVMEAGGHRSSFKAET